MIEIKVNGKEPRSSLIVADSRTDIQAQITGNTLDVIMLLTIMTQNVSRITKIPIEVLTSIISKAPNEPPSMAFDMNQILKMFGKD